MHDLYFRIPMIFIANMDIMYFVVILASDKSRYGDEGSNPEYEKKNLCQKVNMLWLDKVLSAGECGLCLHSSVNKAGGVRGQGYSFFSAGMGEQSVLGGMCPPSYCPVKCTNGLRQGPNGCSICQCAPSAEVNLPGGDPAHQGGASIMGGGFLNSGNYTKPCILNLPCPFHCPQGYATGPDGCQFCICAAKQPVSTTIKPILSPETFTNPCPGIRPGCNKNCTYGYVRGPRGCQYCTCQSPPDTTTPPSEMSKEDACAVAHTKCQLNCPYGFMTDTNQCDICICKDDIYTFVNVPIERQPIVRLTNPCVQGLDRCMIVCASGYLSGPRSCQYCACNE